MAEDTRLSLLEQVRDAAEGEAWIEFVEIYGSMISTWLRAQQIKDEDVADIRQEALATIYAEFPKFQHNGRRGAFRTWIRRITANRLRRHWQSKSRNPGAYAGPDLCGLADELADDSSRLTIHWEKQHDQVILARLLKKIESRFRPHSVAAFRRTTLHEESAHLVAEQLGMTLGAVRVAQHRIHRALQELGKGLID